MHWFQGFTSFTSSSQTEKPLICTMFNKIYCLILVLIGRCIKPEDLVEVERYTLGHRWKVTVSKHILKKLHLHLGLVVKYFCCIMPELKNRKPERSVEDIAKIAMLMPFESSVDWICKQWRLLKLNNDHFLASESALINHFWNNFCVMKAISNEGKYPTAAKALKCCLSFSHGNADVERVFEFSERAYWRKLTQDLSCSMSKWLFATKWKYQKPAWIAPYKKELFQLSHNASTSNKVYLEVGKWRKLKEILRNN